MPRRLRILDAEEIEALYGRPRFTDDDRSGYFTLTQPEQDIMQQLRSVSAQIAFILQVGYFKAKQRFFSLSLDEIEEDVQYILTHNFPQHRRETLDLPHKRTVIKQHRLILERFAYRSCTAVERRGLRDRAAQVVRLCSKPVYVCRHLLQYLTEQRIVAPGYTVLQDLVAEALTAEQGRLITILRAQLSGDECAALDRLYADTPGLHPITLLKHEPRDFSLGEMRQEIQRRDVLQPLAQFASRVLPHLAISPEGISYYASLVTYYTVSRLKRLDMWIVSLYLLCFVAHRYQRLHDHVLTCFVHLVKQYVDEAKAVAKDHGAAERLAHTLDVPKAGLVLKLFTSEQYGETTLFQTVQAQAFHILARPRLEQVADSLAKAVISDETAKEWEHAPPLARRFKPHLRPLLLAIEITAAQSNAPILDAIAFLKATFAKDRSLGQVRAADFPTQVIPKRLRRYLYDQTAAEPHRPLADQYEFLIYQLLRNGLESGDLACRESLRFRSLDDDLISDEHWQNKNALLASTGIALLQQPIGEHLAALEQALEARLLAVNQRIAAGENTHFQLKRQGRQERWTLEYPRESAPVNHPLFATLPPRDIGSVLHFVNEQCQFLDRFDHVLGRYVKSAADDRVISACLVAWAINMGLGRMGEISDISYQTLVQASENFIRLETLKSANDAVSNHTADLPIMRHLDLGGRVHSSSDGQKFETRRPTFNARYGPKFFGLKKGIVVDTLVINHIPVNAQVIGAHEHESHYVFDLLFNNTTTIRPETHSTDTHGANAVNFALLHLFGFQFAPRYADLQEKVRTGLYGFRHPRHYAALTLKPIRKIKDDLIAAEWDNVLRIIVSLALKTTTQSIIVSKLSAHARRSKTLRALWEYDNIIRSLYLLDFIDSPPLRQNVQRALNRGENYHQLRRAISYANLGTLRFRTEEEQQIWSECSRLLANCVISYNASILSELLAHYSAQGDWASVALLTQISLVAWQNTNFYGRYEFTKRPEAIDLALLIEELTQQPITPAPDAP